MAPRRGFVPRRRARFSREEFNRLLPLVPGVRPEQRPVLSSVLQNFLRSGIAAPFLRNGSDEAMDDLVLRFLTNRGERFWVFNHENGYDHLHAEGFVALLAFFRSAQARLYVRRGASAQQHQQQQRQQQQQQQQGEEGEEEEEDDEDEGMMAPLGFALSGLAPTAATTTTPTPAAATTTVLAFRPAPGAEEERIE